MSYLIRKRLSHSRLYLINSLLQRCMRCSMEILALRMFYNENIIFPVHTARNVFSMSTFQLRSQTEVITDDVALTAKV